MRLILTSGADRFSAIEKCWAILTDERFISEDGRSCLQRLPDEDGSTSKAYAVEGYAGRIGFITSMSDHFATPAIEFVSRRMES